MPISSLLNYGDRVCNQQVIYREQIILFIGNIGNIQRGYCSAQTTNDAFNSCRMHVK